jgi:hypothetical protein
LTIVIEEKIRFYWAAWLSDHKAADQTDESRLFVLLAYGTLQIFWQESMTVVRFTAEWLTGLCSTFVVPFRDY